MPEKTNNIEEPKVQSYWIAVFTWFFICLLVSPLIWFLRNHQESELNKKVNNEARKLSAFIIKDIDHRETSLKRLADRWMKRKGTPKKEFYFDAHNYVSDMPGFQAIEWVDDNFIIRWIVPEKGNEKALNLDLGFEEKRLVALEKAKFSSKPTFSGSIDLIQGGKGFLIYFPLYYDNKFDGFILAVFRTSQWLKHVLKNEEQERIENYNIVVSYDGKVVFKKVETENIKHENIRYIESFKIQDHTFRLHLCPNTKFLESEKDYTTEMAAIFGVIMASLIAFTVFMFLKATNESWKTNIAKRNLEDEIIEREKIEATLKETSARLSLATVAGKVGIWSWEIGKNTLIWNDIMHDIYNVQVNTNLSLETWQNMIHPDDREQTMESANDAVSRKSTLNTEFRIILPDGRIRNIQAAAKVETDNYGNPKRMIGVNLDITSMKQVESELKRQTEMQNILMSISSKYINISVDEVDFSINQALSEIGQIVSADIVSVLNYNFQDHTLSNRYEWCSDKADSYIDRTQNLPLTHIWSWVEAHQKHRNFYVSDVSKLPDGDLKKELIKRSIKTFITVPMVNGKELMGFVGFNWVTQLHETTDKEMDLLNLFSQILVNIEMRKTAEIELLENKKRIDLAIKGTKAGLWDWYVQTGETVFNEQWAEIIGYSLDELEPVSIKTWINHCHPDDLEKSNEMLQQHFDGKTEVYETEVRMKHKNGDWVWVVDRGQVVEWDNDNKPLRMTGTHIDITKRKENDEIIKHMATHDALTGLPTLKLGKDRASIAVQQSIRKKKKAGIVFIDLDGFKTVNDNHGHEAGDELLKEVSERFIYCIRKSDTVARIGGDEFLVILNELNNQEDAAMIALKIIEVVSKPFIYKEHRLFVGVSIGISLFPDDGKTVNELVRKADMAMYNVKKSGKNSYAFAAHLDEYNTDQ